MAWPLRRRRRRSRHRYLRGTTARAFRSQPATSPLAAPALVRCSAPRFSPIPPGATANEPGSPPDRTAPAVTSLTARRRLEDHQLLRLRGGAWRRINAGPHHATRVAVRRRRRRRLGAVRRLSTPVHLGPARRAAGRRRFGAGQYACQHPAPVRVGSWYSAAAFRWRERRPASCPRRSTNTKVARVSAAQ